MGVGLRTVLVLSLLTIFWTKLATPHDLFFSEQNSEDEDVGEELKDSERATFFEWLGELVGWASPSTERPVVTFPEDPSVKPQNCPACECGIKNKKNRIVGGVETKVNEYPWMVLLQHSGRFYCGAVLINNWYLLTAAHCVNGFQSQRLKAVLLEHDRFASSETVTLSLKIRRIIRHANYDSKTYNNDIALLKLEEEVKMRGLVRPVCMPTLGKSFTNKTGIVTGWGATKEHGQTAGKLQEVRVPIMSNAECKKTAYGPKRITDNMMCAGYKLGQKDSCQGDSGGPMHVEDQKIYMVAGIVSWGDGCAQANSPGVYTRVNRYLTWIKSNTKDACYCS